MSQRNLERLSDDQLFADWLRWAERLYNDLVGQAWSYRLFRLTRGVLQQNARLTEEGGFYLDWLARNYVAQSAMVLRREMDRQWGTESLRQLLSEIRLRPQVLTRRRFRATWGTDESIRIIDNDFDRWTFISPNHADRGDDYIDPAQPAADLEMLSERAQRVLGHIERTIAHKAPHNPDMTIPSYGDFHETMTAVQEVFSKYYGLLTHKGILQFEPVAQYNEYSAFTFSWIENKETFDYERTR